MGEMVISLPEHAENRFGEFRFASFLYDVIGINDMSLVVGGVFDLNNNWSPPHSNHSRGKAADIRGNGNANSVPRIPDVQNRFMDICRGYGATIVLHEFIGTSNEHFHCEWP